jgi:hypothetical protein
MRHVGADQEAALDAAHDRLCITRACEGLRDARDRVAHHWAARACAAARAPPFRSRLLSALYWVHCMAQNDSMFEQETASSGIRAV